MNAKRPKRGGSARSPNTPAKQDRRSWELVVAHAESMTKDEQIQLMARTSVRIWS